MIAITEDIIPHLKPFLNPHNGTFLEKEGFF
jgi:hypothetical protein